VWRDRGATGFSVKTGALYFSLQSQLPALRAHGLPAQ
jgi:hypothetical protein